MHLYRYRSVKSAIRDIENGAFHFATKDELNDPMEGYVNVYWKGDKPAWEGLFRNYACSLLYAITNYLLAKDESVLWEKTLLSDIHAFDNVPLGDLLRKVGTDVLADKGFNHIISIYGGKELKCRSEELHLVLQLIHFKAFFTCMKYCKESCIVIEKDANRILGRRNMNDLIDQILKQISEQESEIMRESLASVADNDTIDLLESQMIDFGLQKPGFAYGEGLSDGEASEEEKNGRQLRNWMALYIDFPRMYMRQLKNAIYPDVGFVCFSGKNDNSVMWGNYSDNHRGVCLIYDAEYNDSENGKDAGYYNEFGKICPRRVEYGGDIIERNFFETFGRFTLPQIESWLTGTDGSLSKCYDIFKDNDHINEWRNQYWEAFKVKNFRKMEAWNYEDEYRIFINNSFYELVEDDSDNLKKLGMRSSNIKYDMNLLKGVIFGIMTSEYDKVRILKALDKQGIADRIEYYQADFDERSQEVVVRRKRSWGKGG